MLGPKNGAKIGGTPKEDEKANGLQPFEDPGPS